MPIVGIETALYGVEDLATSTKFFEDFGLPLLHKNEAESHFVLEEGSNVILRNLNDTSIPESKYVGTGVKETIWGVDSEASLDRLIEDLSRDREVIRDGDGVAHFLSDCGMALGLKVFHRRKTDTDYLDDNWTPREWEFRFGTTMRDIPPGILESFHREGMPETLIELSKEIWHADMPTPEKFGQVQVRASALGATPQQLGRLNMTLRMFSKQPLEQWAEVMPRVVHIHGRFYSFDADGDEPSIDYAALMRVFCEGGYQGSMSSEWEGHAYTDEFSGFEMVKQHQALGRRLWNAASPL